MANRIHIFGASGSGVTTLGSYLSEQLNGKFLDTDTYYWKNSDPPYQHKNSPEDRVEMIERDISEVDNWVLSGSLCSWGQPLLHRFNFVVFLHLSNELRMARILNREQERYGSRIKPGGDMHEKHVEFMDWARSYDEAKEPIRSLDMHETWMAQLACPVIRLDSSVQVGDLCHLVLQDCVHQTATASGNFESLRFSVSELTLTGCFLGGNRPTTINVTGTINSRCGYMADFKDKT